MSRRDALPEKDWIAIADLASACHSLLLARHDDEALTDGYVDSTADEVVRLAKQAMRAARKLKKHAAVATQKKSEEQQEVQDGV